MSTLTLRRFFVSLPERITTFPHPLTVSDGFVVDHIQKVLRLKPGHEVLVVDAQRATAYIGMLQQDTSSSGKTRQVHLLLTQEAIIPVSKAPKIHLGAALIKEQRWELLLQKSTELGVDRIYPLITQHTIIQSAVIQADKKSGSKQARWQNIVQSATQQSEGWFIPPIQEPSNIAGFIAATSGCDVKIILVERLDQHADTKPLKAVLSACLPLEHKTIALAFGPEGGWHDTEVDPFVSAGFLPASLGSRILRSETAVISVLSNLMYECYT